MSVLVKIWRWSWVVTLPISLIFGIWFWQTANRYLTFGVRYDAAPFTVSLHRTGAVEFVHLLRNLKLAATANAFSKDDSESLRNINLFVTESNLNRLDGNLPYSGFEYVDGLIYNEGTFQKIEYRYRGDFIYHWGRHKRSIRVKTKKKNLFEGIRTFNLIAPKSDHMFSNYFGYKLAEKFGLITPISELVNVNLNGENQGVHVLVEQLDELTLRRSRRMPGDLYGGELLGKDAVEGARGDIFESPGLWKKIAVNNHYAEESFSPLDRLTSLVNSEPTDLVQAKLSDLLDLDMWGKFAAFETIGQTFHYDNIHNWRLYFDPITSKFIPVIWDPMVWNGSWMPREGALARFDVLPSKLHNMLMYNSDFLEARHSAISAFFESGMDLELVDDIEQAMALMEGDIINDPHLGVLVHRDGGSGQDPYRAIAMQQELLLGVRNILRDIEGAYLADIGEAKYVADSENSVFAITFSGRSPAQQIVFRYAQDIPKPDSVVIRYWRDGKQVEVDVSGAVSTSGAELRIDSTLLTRFEPIEVGTNPLLKTQLTNLPAYYEIQIAGFENMEEQGVTIDRGIAGFQSLIPVEQLDRISFGRQYRPVAPAPVSVPLLWQGEKFVNSVIDIYQDTTILPGTKIILGPDAGIVFHSQVVAVGTEDEPIQFVGAAAGQDPWGAVVLLGQGAAGSRFGHCEFSEGSGIKADLYEYSAMFSIHDVDDVVVDSCIFKDSKLVDDMVHVAYADNITLKNSTFIRAFSDALDIDISTGLIEGSTFIDSGNDAIDLMASNVKVVASYLRASGDKGISVGEGSRLLAINNRIEGNAIGIQTKDGSIATLYNIELVNNTLALDSYKKNWRYNSGGRTYVYNSVLSGNAAMITADKDSQIWVYDSSYDMPIETRKRRIWLDSTTGRNSGRDAVNADLWRFPEEEADMLEFQANAFLDADPAIRGTVNLVYED